MTKNKKIMLWSVAIVMLCVAFGVASQIPYPKVYTEIKANAEKHIAAKQESADTPKISDIQFPKDNHNKGMFKDDLVYGDINAPVTVIEYASLTCHHCADFHKNTFPDLKKAYIDTGKIRFVYRDYPLNAAALAAAQVARCDGASKYKSFISVIMDKQDDWMKGNIDVVKENLASIGRLGGLSDEDIKACFTSKELEDAILIRQQDAQNRFNIEATPSFIINGKKVAGDHSLEALSKVIDPMLLTK